MKLSAIRPGVLGLAALGLLAVAGCTKGIKRPVDPSRGEFYSAEEFKKLNKEQRNAYCAELDAQLARLQSEASETEQKAKGTERDVAALQREIQDLERRYAAANDEVTSIEEEIDYYEGLPRTWTVQKGEYLYKISGYEQIYADPLKWPRIYRANKDRIEDPDLIYPGWELAIPRDWPSTWTVRQDEYLSKIAWYWEVYDDPKDWTRLYEANKDQIKDPDMVWPGWVLRIPRDTE